jgi:transcriptional regulator with XRE-family HTH domain
MDNFASRFKDLRGKLGFSQRKFAEKLGIPSTAISKYEQELIKPSAELLTKIGFLGVNINWLLTGEGEMFTRPQEGEAAPAELDPRLAAIVGLLSDMPEEQVDEVYKYISKEKRMADLEKAVEELRTKTG